MTQKKNEVKDQQFSVQPICEGLEPTPESHVEIFRMVNKRRRYRPNDFKGVKKGIVGDI